LVGRAEADKQVDGVEALVELGAAQRCLTSLPEEGRKKKKPSGTTRVLTQTLRSAGLRWRTR
jgi:hypothetical protein